MMNNTRIRFSAVLACALAAGVFSTPARGAELWVAPTYQWDTGITGVGSNSNWPVTSFGSVRFAWAIPNDVHSFESAKITLIPDVGGAASLNVLVCASRNGDAIAGGCSGPFVQGFTGITNHLIEVEIGGIIAARIGTPGATYMAVFAYTTPSTWTDHIVGLRFTYASTAPAGAATLGANTFTGTQTAPAFVGDGSGLKNLPIPVDVARLGANTFSGPQTAPGFVGSGAGLTAIPVAAVVGAATVGANTFTGTQTITSGNLLLDNSTGTTGMLIMGGARFLHNSGSNLFLGAASGNTTTTGSNNIAIGTIAMGANTTGASNTVVGHDALVGNLTGSNNVAAGFFTLNNNKTGFDNTALGTFALDSNSTGAGNVAVGRNAGIFATTGSNNIYLGANVNGVAAESNAMYLGRVGVQTKTIIAGVRGTTTLNADAIPLVIDSAGQLGTVSSSIRFKEDIHEMADASRRLLQLRPVTFRYRQAYADGSKPIQFGLVAEDVAETFPELAVRDANGKVETVHYETLNVLLLNEMQQQQRRIDALEQQVTQLLSRPH